MRVWAVEKVGVELLFPDSLCSSVGGAGAVLAVVQIGVRNTPARRERVRTLRVIRRSNRFQI